MPEHQQNLFIVADELERLFREIGADLLILCVHSWTNALDRVTKGADGYPPYNIERVPREDGYPERLRITLAVAGFTRDQLDVSIEESQLLIRGRQQDDKSRQYLHRGIAARQFQRTFVLADGMEVLGADLKNGLLSIDLARPTPERIVKSIDIAEHD